MAEVPIDHGWGWFVVIGSFINIMFVIGGARSFGIIFVHLTERFDATSASAAWSVGLLIFGMSFYGPFASFISKKYSFRVTAMIGGMAQGLSFVISAFAPNVYFVSLMIGLVDGFGTGFLYTTSISAVSQYFNKRRSLAVGIAVSGSSVGQLVLPQLIRYLLDQYGYFGCMLIYGALSWNSVLAGALYRPLSFYKPQKKCVELRERTNIDNMDNPGDKMAAKKTSTNCEGGMEEDNNSTEDRLYKSEADDMYLGSLSMLPDDQPAADVENDVITDTRAIGCCNEKFRKKIKSILDLGFMRHPNFWFYTAAIFLANPTLINLVLFIPPYAKQIGIDKKRASLVLSTGSVCDFIGKLAAGAFETLHLVRVRHLLTVVLAVIVVVSVVCLAYPCFASLLTMVVAMGTCGGVFVAMHPVYLLEIFPTETFTMAFGFAVGIHSISAFILPIVAGAVADLTGSYKIPYWMCLILVLFAAILFQMQPVGDKIYRRLEKKRDPQQRQSVSEIITNSMQ